MQCVRTVNFAACRRASGDPNAARCDGTTPSWVVACKAGYVMNSSYKCVRGNVAQQSRTPGCAAANPGRWPVHGAPCPCRGQQARALHVRTGLGWVGCGVWRAAWVAVWGCSWAAAGQSRWHAKPAVTPDQAIPLLAATPTHPTSQTARARGAPPPTACWCRQMRFTSTWGCLTAG